MLHEKEILTLYADTEKYGKNGDMVGHNFYEKAMLEPGVCAISKTYKKLYGWALIPAAKNFGGAVGRVRGKDAWKAIKKSLDGDLSLNNWIPDDIANISLSWPRRLFVKFLLLAEGNFIRPHGLELPESGVSARGQGHFRKKILKCLGKLACLVGFIGWLGRTAPKFTVSAVIAYVIYYQIYCEPVYQASWHLNRPKPDGNALPSLYAAAKL